MRKLNAMFHIDDEGHLIKTSNNSIVPEDEPLFVLRGRDALAIETLHHYVALMAGSGGDPQRMLELGYVVHDFRKFSENHPERMKQPGVTRGK